jgi:hypothetical protein
MAKQVQNDDDNQASTDSLDDPNANYVMGEIVVDDGSIVETESDLDEYTEEVDDDSDAQTKAKKKLIGQGTSDDPFAGNPSDTDDFTKFERYDADEDWPLE